ncbi:MAG: N-6 DNA methylase [Chloroflexi bacterium]|nr:N-6 DNA methylase [Chloroflexota bacterium]
MISPESARQEIARLVARYKALSPRQRKDYNEAATRQGFILPLFQALGWDIYNTSEVSPEENVSRGFVDFAFRIGGIPKFFLETKKLPADLADPEFARQAINYAWTKGVTWAVLCDFEGLKVFNAEVREADPRQAIFLEFTADTYLSDFDRLWYLSRPACEANTLDREAERWGKRTRKRPVGEQLLDNLMEWRRELYRHLRQYNPTCSPQQIDEAVQRTLDRLVFIRTVEDRGIEERRLIGLAREYKDAIQHRRRYDLIPRLVALFREYDGWYDSRLFERHLLEDLQCEPEPFVRVIEGLYQPDEFTTYDFNAIDADVLGAIYEQYLGHAAQERGKDVVELEAKKSKRKAQGIYYTPQFVVRYIVRQTLGRLLEERGLEGARNVRVLDPACGSGSFLIEAFDVLDRFLANARGQNRPVPDAGADNRAADFHAHARRMEILSRNLYGVDLDAQAVEVAQLNLLLRAANERGRLPRLDHIRQGNSLISDDVGATHASPLWDMHPFNWHTEFPEVMAEGGFDVVIGNPPYVFGEYLPPDQKEFFEKHYELAKRQYDLYWLFYERCVSLLRPGGYHGYIVPDAILARDEPELLRRFLLANGRIVSISHVGRVFTDPAVSGAVIVFQRERAPEQWRINIDLVTVAEARTVGYLLQSSVRANQRCEFALEQTSDWQRIEAKLQMRSVQLGEIARLTRGEELGKKSLQKMGGRIPEGMLPILAGECVRRYYVGAPRHVVPEAYVQKPRTNYEAPKLLIVKTGANLVCGLDANGYVTLQSVYNVQLLESAEADIRYVLALLNSKLLSACIQKRVTAYKKIFPQINQTQVLALPIRALDLSDPAERAMHDRMVALVERMLHLKREHAEAEAALEDRRHDLAREIARTDREIDRLVYQLYGLTDEEIAIVEGQSPAQE